jgi:molecular chaperone GrpE (heat shock protein)
MYEGLLSINTIMQKTFAKHGLNTIRPEVGTELDPHTMQVGGRPRFYNVAL